jgi:hypothetical protein
MADYCAEWNKPFMLTPFIPKPAMPRVASIDEPEHV